MVGPEKQRPVAVRFLIDTAVKKGSSFYAPWKLYQIPEFVLDILKIPYEILEPTPLQVGTRIAKLASAMDFSLSGSCCGCTELQKLLDATTPEWIQKHITEIAEQIQYNARKKIHFSPPKRMIKEAIQLAIVLERRALRRRYRKMSGKDA